MTQTRSRHYIAAVLQGEFVAYAFAEAVKIFDSNFNRLDTLPMAEGSYDLAAVLAEWVKLGEEGGLSEAETLAGCRG